MRFVLHCLHIVSQHFLFSKLLSDITYEYKYPIIISSTFHKVKIILKRILSLTVSNLQLNSSYEKTFLTAPPPLPNTFFYFGNPLISMYF